MIIFVNIKEKTIFYTFINETFLKSPITIPAAPRSFTL